MWAKCSDRKDIIYCHCFQAVDRLTISLTRFVEISPLWHKLKCLWEFYEGLFSGGQKLLPTLEQFVYNIIE